MYRLRTFCLAISVQAGLVVISTVFGALSLAIIITNFPDFDFNTFATKAVIVWVVLLLITAVVLVFVAYSENWIAALVSVVLMTLVVLVWLFLSLPPLIEQVDKNYIEGRDYEVNGDYFKFLGYDGKSIGATDARRGSQKNYCIKLRCGETMWLLDMGWRTMYTEWTVRLLKFAQEKKRRPPINHQIDMTEKSGSIIHAYRQKKARRVFTEYNLKFYKPSDWDRWMSLMPELSELKKGSSGSVFKSYVSGYGAPCRYVETPTTRKPTTKEPTTTTTTTTTTPAPTTTTPTSTIIPSSITTITERTTIKPNLKATTNPKIDIFIYDSVVPHHLIFPMKNLDANYYSQAVSTAFFAIFSAILIYFELIVISAFICLG